MELYVGVGASRVRDLFEQAKKVPPPSSSSTRSTPWAAAEARALAADTTRREQTLNQLLVEMDGFGQRGVIVIAATNRQDILDPALLRPAVSTGRSTSAARIGAAARPS